MAGTINKGPVPSEGRLAAEPLETDDLWSTGDPKQNASTERPSPPSLCRSAHARARRRDGSWEPVVALPESCCPAQRSPDFPNRDFRCACGRVPFGFSSRYLASRSRCLGRVQRFASASCRPWLLQARALKHLRFLAFLSNADRVIVRVVSEPASARLRPVSSTLCAPTVGTSMRPSRRTGDCR
jgi:hypothetical protein